MWKGPVGHPRPAPLPRPEELPGLVSPLSWELEILQVVPFHQVPRGAPAVPPGFHNHPACPSPSATTLGLNPKAPARLQV